MECTDGEYHSEEGKVSWSKVGDDLVGLLCVGRQWMSGLDKGYLGEENEDALSMG